MIIINWNEAKQLIDNGSVRYKQIEYNDRYEVYGFDGGFKFQCTVAKNTVESADYENGYNSNATTVISDKDSSGREFVRYAITDKGWSFLAHFIEGTTSTLGSIYCEDHDGTVETQHYCKFYDVNGTELTDQATIDTSCVKSVFTIVPALDYEIVSGEIHQYERPTTDVRMHSLIGAFLPDGTPLSYKSFVRNLNMKFKDKAKAIVTDGRSPKLLEKDYAGLPVDANQIQIVVNHDAGVKHEFMVELEYYRQ